MEVPSILLNRILATAAKKGSSSLHLTVGSPPMVRINDKLSVLEGENILTLETLDKTIKSFLEEGDQARLAENKEMIFVKNFAGNFRFRVNIFYQKNLPAVSFRYIPDKIKTLAELAIPQPVSDTLKSNSGLFIIAGSYGSGKTATAAAMIEEINKNFNKRIITIEDPLEYSFFSSKSIIEQRQVGRDVKTFVDGLNYCLEEDVDLVYVGEIRKELSQAMPIILELASGNSLVIMELDANSSTRAIERILSSLSNKLPIEAARYNLADVLIGVIVQKLLPRRGGGMILAAEVLLANSAVKSLIREGKIYQLESVMQTSRKEGMINMEKTLEEMIRAGEIKSEDS